MSFNYDWVGASVDDSFKKKVVEISNKLGMIPDDLMAIMAFESDLDHTKVNFAGYVGLIQFGSDVLSDLGLTKEQLNSMTAVEQLDVVYDYFIYKQIVFEKANNLGDWYMLVLWVFGVGKPDSYILFNAGDGMYESNAPLDINRDGSITRGEAVSFVIERRETYGKK